MRLYFLISLAAMALGCAGPQANGTLVCDPSTPCPVGYYCGPSGTCWMNDALPDGGWPMPPPRAWLASGGSSSSGGLQLNLSIGGTPIAGPAHGTQGDAITFGVFSTDSYSY